MDQNFEFQSEILKNLEKKLDGESEKCKLTHHQLIQIRDVDFYFFNINFFRVQFVMQNSCTRHIQSAQFTKPRLRKAHEECISHQDIAQSALFRNQTHNCSQETWRHKYNCEGVALSSEVSVTSEPFDSVVEKQKQIQRPPLTLSRCLYTFRNKRIEFVK